MNNEEIKTTAEESGIDINALQDQLNKLMAENDKLRKAQTNASADASKYKKELAARMTEEEKAKSEREEQLNALQSELKTLRRDKDVSGHMASFLSVGYSNDLARSSAEAIVDGDFDKVFNDLGAFISAHDKEINAQVIKNTPKPGVGSTDTKISKEKFDKMSYRERVAFYNENPDLYNELSK